MYRAQEKQMSIYDYIPPYHGELAGRNRWVRLAEATDWDAIEQAYSAHFARSGKVAIPARIAYGSLVIRAAYRLSDRETVAIIKESPYLQFYLGLATFGDELPFSARSMVYFRARIPHSQIRADVKRLHGFEDKQQPQKPMQP